MNTGQTIFSSELYRFFRELKDNNNRAWFEANKGRYLNDVRDPMMQFIVLMQAPLGGISRHIRIDPRPVGGSMFRIYRDTRFSRDKTPYKTQAACHFQHRAGGHVHSVGYYLHLGPDGNWVGGGIWRPPAADAHRIRSHIDDFPERWHQATRNRLFLEHTDGVEGDQLRRVPRDFDPHHPLTDDLRRKEFLAGTSPTDEQVLAPDFVDYVTDVYRAMAPFMAFLAAALDLEW